MGPKIKVFLVVALLLTLTILVIGCGGGEQAQEDPTEEQSAGEQTAAEPKTEQGANTAAKVENEATKEESAGGEGSGQEVTLKIEGDPGTEFSGACSVGEEGSDLGGQVPQSFVYDLRGQKLECEIWKQGAEAGNLKVTLLSGNNRSVQQINSPDGTINLTYSSGNGISSSVSSSSSSGSVSQQQVVNQVVNSSSSSSTSSR